MSSRKGAGLDPRGGDGRAHGPLALGALRAVRINLAENRAPGLRTLGGAGVSDGGLAVIYGDTWGVEVAATAGEQEGGGGADDGAAWWASPWAGENCSSGRSEGDDL